MIHKQQRNNARLSLAYHIAEVAGIELWCQDEAGPYATRPQPGASWHLQDYPHRQPHEYLRDGGAKLLTLFRPATGEVRAKGVPSVTNAVLHPWLKEDLTQILEPILRQEAEALPLLPSESERPVGAALAHLVVAS